MEPWQIQIIHNNLSFLIHKVTCTATLLSKLEERNVVNTYNVQILAAARTQIAKSSQLINLLKTKSHAFDIFIEVLIDIDVKQYAPAKLLYDERKKHYQQQGIPRPTLRYLEIPNSSALLPSHAVVDSPAHESRPAIELSSGSSSSPRVIHPLADAPSLPLSSFVTTSSPATKFIDVNQPD